MKNMQKEELKKIKNGEAVHLNDGRRMRLNQLDMHKIYETENGNVIERFSDGKAVVNEEWFVDVQSDEEDNRIPKVIDADDVVARIRKHNDAVLDFYDRMDSVERMDYVETDEVVEDSLDDFVSEDADEVMMEKIREKDERISLGKENINEVNIKERTKRRKNRNFSKSRAQKFEERVNPDFRPPWDDYRPKLFNPKKSIECKKETDGEDPVEELTSLLSLMNHQRRDNDWHRKKAKELQKTREHAQRILQNMKPTDLDDVLLQLTPEKSDTEETGTPVRHIKQQKPKTSSNSVFSSARNSTSVFSSARKPKFSISKNAQNNSSQRSTPAKVIPIQFSTENSPFIFNRSKSKAVENTSSTPTIEREEPSPKTGVSSPKTPILHTPDNSTSVIPEQSSTFVNPSDSSKNHLDLEEFLFIHKISQEICQDAFDIVSKRLLNENKTLQAPVEVKQGYLLLPFVLPSPEIIVSSVHCKLYLQKNLVYENFSVPYQIENNSVFAFVGLKHHLPSELFDNETGYLHYDDLKYEIIINNQYGKGEINPYEWEHIDRGYLTEKGRSFIKTLLFTLNEQPRDEKLRIDDSTSETTIDHEDFQGPTKKQGCCIIS